MACTDEERDLPGMLVRETNRACPKESFSAYLCGPLRFTRFTADYRRDAEDRRGTQRRLSRRSRTNSEAALRDQLQHVYWIGGGSGAGKSTIARRIAAQHGLRVYSTDDMMGDHAGRSRPEDSPLLREFMAMDMDERWVNRSPETLLATFHWFQGEGFNLIVEDLLALPRQPAVIVEGFRLLPALVKPLLSVPAHAVWLLPTPEFRRAVLDTRGGSSWGFLAKTSNPEQAFRNLLERDRMFTDILREETARLDLPAIDVDTTTTEADLAERVTRVLGV